MELSGQFPVQQLCQVLDINRSGFYKWKKRLEHPSGRLKSFISNLMLFKGKRQIRGCTDIQRIFL